MSSSAKVTVIGIGNPIMGDDGIGLALLAAVQGAAAESWPVAGVVPEAVPSRPSPMIEYVDGGTAGMELLPIIQDAQSLLLLDAVAGPGVPGSVVCLIGDQVPRLQQGKLSPHQVGLLDLLSAARILGREPGRVAVVGIVPESVDLRLGLSEVVANAVVSAASVARGLLDDWLADG